jgi:hypothetical protein
MALAQISPFPARSRVRAEGKAMPIAEQFHAATAAARNFPALDEISRTLWQAHAAGVLSDDAAQAAAEAVEARKAVLRGPRPVPTQKRAYAAPRPRSPDRARSIRRRRAVAASGVVPSRLAATFTLGEVAALSIIAGEVRRNGRCDLPIDAIAAMSGVCRRTAQNAIRQAERLGLLTVHARPRPGQKSETNIIEVICPQWRAWLCLGIDRVQKTASHEYQRFNSCKNTSRKHGDGWRFRSVPSNMVATQQEAQRCNRKRKF